MSTSYEGKKAVSSLCQPSETDFMQGQMDPVLFFPQFSVLIYLDSVFFLPSTLILPLESVCDMVISSFLTWALGCKFLHASTCFQSTLC